jgi:pilus assembly protein CpaB
VSVRTVLVVAFALVFGGSAAVGVNSLVNGNRPDAKKMETIPVVVAAIDIPRGGTITSDLIKLREYPKDLAPQGVITKREDAIDRAVFTPLVKDEPVFEGKLAPKGSGRGMAALVPPGMRAFTIQTTNVASGVGGFVLPGNKVDVLLTMNGGSKAGGGITTTLLQNVEILAVDQRIDAPADNRVDPNNLRSVTLLVTPDQAAKLDLGQNKGTLHLALRNAEDSSPADARPTTLAGLEGYQELPWDERAKGVLSALGKALTPTKTQAEAAPVAPPAPAPPPAPVALRPQPRVIRIYRGATSIQELAVGDALPQATQVTDSRGSAN